MDKLAEPPVLSSGVTTDRVHGSLNGQGLGDLGSRCYGQPMKNWGGMVSTEIAGRQKLAHHNGYISGHGNLALMVIALSLEIYQGSYPHYMDNVAILG